jgi:squalene synthase HpnC
MVGPVHVRLLREPPPAPPAAAEARAFCRRLATSHYENFTVLSWLAPHRIRQHLANVYAYCRTVDDIGDEADGGRLALLDAYESQLDRAYQGTPNHPVLVALAETIAAFDLPKDLFRRLIEANRIDQRCHRHPDFASLLDYCAYSANPVGRLVLALRGYRDEERAVLSDATCTGLQLANFWQDLRRDFSAGRVYLPQDEMSEYGVRDSDLAADAASPALRRLTLKQVARARSYFEAGLPLLSRVSGGLRVELALFTGGGLAVLDRIEAQAGDTLQQRPTVGRVRKAAIFWTALARTGWRRCG